MNVKLLLVLLPLIITIFFLEKKIYAQQLVLEKEKNTNSITCVSIDRNGKFVIGDAKGNITQYDSLGNLISRFSPTELSTPCSIEAWRTMNLFVFYKELQQFILLDRFLASSSTFELNLEEIGFSRVATISQDNMIWLFDEINFRLKKYNPTTSKLINETPLDLILDPRDFNITSIREYQNLLFISDQNQGILLFDNLGNYKKTIPASGITYFNFLEEELYYTKDNTLFFINIYTLKERRITLPMKNSIIFVLVTEKKIITFEKNKFYILNIRSH